MSDIKSLKKGIQLFIADHCHDESNYNEKVTHGQSPKIMVIACSDSLVDPAVLMNAAPGELFTHRNIAGLVPPYQSDERDKYHGTSAVIEYGVQNLEVEHIIVLGHGNCGGIKTIIHKQDNVKCNSFVTSWMRIAQPVFNKLVKLPPECSLTEKQHICEKEAIILSLNNLMTFPWIKDKVHLEKLHIHGWHFDRGVFTTYNPKSKIFE